MTMFQIVNLACVFSIVATAIAAVVIAWTLTKRYGQLKHCEDEEPRVVGAPPVVLTRPHITKFWATDTGSCVHMGHCGKLTESKHRVRFCKICTDGIKGTPVYVV